MSGLVKRTAIVLLLPLLLAGCGVRGSLEAPAEAKAEGTATSPDAADAGPKSAAAPKPHRGFIPDGLVI